MSKESQTVQPNRVLLVLCTAAFLVPFMGSAINLALPEIGEAFSMKAVTLTWMSTIYLITTAIFQVPFARLADLIGRKKIFLLGVLSFSICTILSGFSPTGGALLALRSLSGLGSAMMFGTNMAILTAVFPPHQRGRAMGINVAVVYAALAAGPFLGGMLTHYFGWQSLFFATGVIGLLVVMLSHFYLKAEWVEAKGEKFDLVGSVIYGIALFGLIYGFTKLPSTDSFYWLSAGIILFVVFFLYERRLSSPVFNVKIFNGNRIFTLSSISMLINYAATSAVAFMLSLYLQYVRGFDARHAGLILISQACIQAIFSLLAGRLSEKIAPSRLATTGMAIIVLGLTGMSFITAETSVTLLVVLLVMLGIGFGIFSSPNTNVIMSSVDKKYYGQASATTGTMRLTGQAFSMGIAGMAIAINVGNRQITHEVYPELLQSIRVTLVIFAALCVVGVYASSQRTRK